MLRSIVGMVALPKAGFVSAVLMTTLHALSKVGLTYMAMPVGSARVTALLAPPSSQITRVGVARAELARSIAPKAIAAKYLIMLCVIYFVCFVLLMYFREHVCSLRANILLNRRM